MDGTEGHYFKETQNTVGTGQVPGACPIGVALERESCFTHINTNMHKLADFHIKLPGFDLFSHK